MERKLHQVELYNPHIIMMKKARMNRLGFAGHMKEKNKRTRYSDRKISNLKGNIRDLGIDGMVLTLKTIGLEPMN